MEHSCASRKSFRTFSVKLESSASKWLLPHKLFFETCPLACSAFPKDHGVKEKSLHIKRAMRCRYRLRYYARLVKLSGVCLSPAGLQGTLY